MQDCRIHCKKSKNFRSHRSLTKCNCKNTTVALPNVNLKNTTVAQQIFLQNQNNTTVRWWLPYNPINLTPPESAPTTSSSTARCASTWTLLEDCVAEIKVNSGDITYAAIKVTQAEHAQDVKVGDQYKLASGEDLINVPQVSCRGKPSERRRGGRSTTQTAQDTLDPESPAPGTVSISHRT